jgi:hypothetical protein
MYMESQVAAGFSLYNPCAGGTSAQYYWQYYIYLVGVSMDRLDGFPTQLQR